MSLLNALFPKTILYKNTPFNKNITVTLGLGEPTLMVDGLVESGSILTNIWDTAIQKLLPKKFQPESILLLGLGGGSNANLARHHFPSSHITAVEIDPQMLEIAQKHYGLSKLKNFEVVISDAIDFAKNTNSSYDLILVDCFVGKYIPKKMESLKLFKRLSQISRYTLINRIWYNEHHLDTVFFMRQLSSQFFFIKAHNSTNVILSLV